MRARIVSYIWGTTRGGKKEEEVSMRTVLCASIGYVGKKMYQFPFHSGGDNEAFFSTGNVRQKSGQMRF